MCSHEKRPSSAGSVSNRPEHVRAAVIGAGPAGLAAAEVLVDQAIAPVLFDAMPSPARKFLMAGKSGLNLTKDVATPKAIETVGCAQLAPILSAFGPPEVMSWAEGLGEEL